MPDIKLKNINNFVLDNINLKVSDKEFLVLWGETGAGKTTLLNIIAGLIEYKGSVLFNNIPVDKFHLCQKKIGYHFQNLILFPHMNVSSNIAYGLHVQKKTQKEINFIVDELLKLMNIEHLATRFPKDLSGGEKQRVSLARTIAPSPEIMLLDEPLNSLDFNTANNLKMEIKKFQKKLRITTIYVTHCFEEAFSLADRIAVLHNGKIIQIDSPENIFKKTDCKMIMKNKPCDCHKEK